MTENRQRGQAVVEYALLIVLLVAIAAVALFALGTQSAGFASGITNAVTSSVVPTAAPTCPPDDKDKCHGKGKG